GAMLLAASSPHARSGTLWDAYRRYHGKPGPVLVWKAPTLTMNPSASRRQIDEAYERDPEAAAAEYGAEFRSDLAAFVTRETVLACVDEGTRERPAKAGVTYTAFVDPSGGSADSF